MKIRTLREAIRACGLVAAAAVAWPAALTAQNAGGAPAPQGLWAAQNAPAMVVLSWQAVPGATGYRLYCAAGGAAPRLIGRPASNATQWLLQVKPAMIGVVHDCTLEADSHAGSSGPVAFNPFTPQAGGAPATAPSTIVAQQTGAAEITVSWADVSGATAYFVARSAGGEGFRIVCQLCPNTPSYIDRGITPGVRYTYSVAAITPAGTSRRIASSALVADPAHGQAPAANGGSRAANTSAAGQSAGAATAGATQSGTQAGSTQTTAAGTTTAGVTAGGGRAGGTTTGTRANAGLRNPRIPGGSGGGTGGGGTGGGTSGGGKGGTGGGSTHGSTSPQPCTLEYQRADNMWAAMGRPDGNLGTERITLQPGQTRAFVTDWAYEKKTNDGTNYYGSHGRIVRNAGGGAVAFRIRGEIDDPQYNIAGGISVHPNLLVSLQPGASVDVKADLLEVSCQ